MALEVLLSQNQTSSLIEGPMPRWRAGPKTTRVTAMAQEQRKNSTCAHAVATQEKLIGDNNLRPISFLQLALKVSEAVGMIQVTSKGSATGFMITPDVLLTNNHVITSSEEGSRSRIRFNYQLDMSGRLAQSEYFACRPDVLFYTSPTLDYSIIAVENSPGLRYGVIAPSRNRIVGVGESVGIIQHPMGEPKQIAIVDNEVEYVDDQIVQYLTDTLPGSSGSPVFNDAWELIALHHSGGWLPEPSSTSTHFRNEGILISAIVADLIAVGLAG